MKEYVKPYTQYEMKKSEYEIPEINQDKAIRITRLGEFKPGKDYKPSIMSRSIYMYVAGREPI